MAPPVTIKGKPFYVDIDLRNNKLNNASLGANAELADVESAIGYDNGEIKYRDATSVQTLATKEYVDSVAGDVTASNGLTKIGNDIQLGGTITVNTDIIPDVGGSRSLNIGNDSFKIGGFALKTNYGEIVADGGGQQIWMSSIAGVPRSRVAVSGSGGSISLTNLDDSFNLLSKIELSNNQISVSGDSAFNGITYSSDYSTNYTNRSLVDKEYVDNAISGGGGSGPSYSYSVLAATTENITLSGFQSIDGVSVSSGFNVLVKDQTTTSENGV